MLGMSPQSAHFAPVEHPRPPCPSCANPMAFIRQVAEDAFYAAQNVFTCRDCKVGMTVAAETISEKAVKQLL